MQRLNFHTNKLPPPLAKSDIPILIDIKMVYLLWCDQFRKLPKPVRYTLGMKVDAQFLTIIDLMVRAQYKRAFEKTNLLQTISEEFDVLKYFVTMLWEIKAIDDRIFSLFAKHFGKIGKSLGGWMKDASQKSKKR